MITSYSILAVLIWNCLGLIDAQSIGTSIGTNEKLCCFKDTVVTSCYKPCLENRCENLLNASRICPPEVCTPNICVCRDGLYLNKCNQCVQPQECSKPCDLKKIQCPGQFETLYGCLEPAQARVCPATRCSKPRDFLLKYQMNSRQQGLCGINRCDCIDGYLRNKCGQCVPASECDRKFCVGKQTPCSDPNEVRVSKFRKCTERSCKNLKSSSKCSGKLGKIRKNVCDCKIGYRRNKCGLCVPESQCCDNVPCVCTNPCPFPGFAWDCINECNRRNCAVYYELNVFRNRTCPSDAQCTYICGCDPNKNLWFNGTACVPGDQCPSYEIAKQTKLYSVAELAIPTEARGLTPTQTTEGTTTIQIVSSTTAQMDTSTQASIINNNNNTNIN